MYRKLICILVLFIKLTNNSYGKNSINKLVDTLFVEIDYQNIIYKIENINDNSVSIYTKKTINLYKKIELLPQNDTSEISKILPSITVIPYSEYIYHTNSKVEISDKIFAQLTVNKKVINYIEYENIKQNYEINTVVFFFEKNQLNKSVVYYRVVSIYPD